MRHAALALTLLLTLLTAGAGPTPQIAGIWSGMINAPDKPSLLVLQIDRSGDGLAAIAVTPYQGGGTIPVETITQKNASISFTIAKLGLSFNGTIASGEIEGTLNGAGPSMPFTLTPNALGTQDVRGAWLGAIDVSGKKLLLGLRIAKGANGWSALLDSPQQDAYGIPTVVTVTPADLTFAIPAAQLSFHGRLTGTDIDGTFTQEGQSYHLTLTRPQISQAILAPVPTPPPHFSSQDVSFTSSDGAILAGTLTIPDDARGKLPAFVFIHGSGAETRDGGVKINPTFLDLSNALSNGGAIVLRYDKRGIGKSTGTPTEDLAPLAADARAAVTYLMQQTRVDPRRIYLLGHSEGGLIAPVVAAADRRIAGIVLLAPPAVPISRILEEQSPRMTPAQYGQLKQYFHTYDGIDPAQVIRHVDVPILILQGTADIQVLPSDLDHLTQAARAAHKQLTVDLLSDDDHLFIHATPGSTDASEYDVPEPLDPRVAQDILSWMHGT